METWKTVGTSEPEILPVTLLSPFITHPSDDLVPNVLRLIPSASSSTLSFLWALSDHLEWALKPSPISEVQSDSQCSIWSPQIFKSLDWSPRSSGQPPVPSIWSLQSFLNFYQVFLAPTKSLWLSIFYSNGSFIWNPRVLSLISYLKRPPFIVILQLLSVYKNP